MRANKSVGRLRALGAPHFAEKVRESLYGDSPQAPPSTIALARLCWPLILTTNYDDCLVTAFNEAHGIEMAVCGRKPDDTQYVLNALNEPVSPILWALQGYLGGPLGKTSDNLAGQIVVGHEEYRKVAHAEPQFRRAFAEVFRNRSMLFLGSGLREPYFREMFSEILEIFGPCARPHYAFVKKGELDIQFLATSFQIIVVEYDDHELLPKRLNALAEAVEKRAFRQDRVTYAMREAQLDDVGASCQRFTVARGRLPAATAQGECLAVSSGGAPGGAFFFSDSIETLLDQMGVQGQPVQLPSSRFVARFGESPVYTVRAREPGDVRALRVVRRATMEMLDAAWNDGFRRVLMQVLASGGSKGAAASHDNRPYTALFSFVESVRAFGAWCRAYPDQPMELTMCVLDASIFSEITRGRLDVQELLSSLELRFWAKAVFPGDRIHRQMCQELEEFTVGELAEWISLDVSLWHVSSVPPIGSAEEAKPVRLAVVKDDALSTRVIPGGTLRFTIESE